VSTCCSAFREVSEQQFDGRKAAQELARYRKNGPGPTTRLLRDALIKGGLVDGLLLDIGAGFGALTFDLLDRGSSRAVIVEASSSYLALAAGEAARRGQSGNVEFVHADFLDVAPQLQRAAIVTLDRVVCCYPLMEPLLAHALEHAERALALSYPRDVWFVRAVMAGDNVTRQIAGKRFRTFVHSAARMERLIRDAGFELSSRRQTWTWSADVYVRAR
jgi:magnesium-protoporphyrin O-methyltransferase